MTVEDLVNALQKLPPRTQRLVLFATEPGRTPELAAQGWGVSLCAWNTLLAHSMQNLPPEFVGLLAQERDAVLSRLEAAERTREGSVESRRYHAFRRLAWGALLALTAYFYLRAPPS